MKVPKFPSKGDHPPYFDTYLKLVEGKEFLSLMNEQVKEIEALFEEKGEDWAEKAYARGKWTPKQVLGHISDTERVMAYRALCIARGDQSKLPGMDQDLYVAEGGFNHLASKDLLSDFKIQRIATLSLIRLIPEDSFEFKGNANENDIIVNSLFWIIPAHFAHHYMILKERY